MQSFREDLMSKPCLATIKEVINGLIPPKELKWENNIEGLFKIKKKAL